MQFGQQSNRSASRSKETDECSTRPPGDHKQLGRHFAFLKPAEGVKLNTSRESLARIECHSSACPSWDPVSVILFEPTSNPIFPGSTVYSDALRHSVSTQHGLREVSIPDTTVADKSQETFTAETSFAEHTSSAVSEAYATISSAEGGLPCRIAERHPCHESDTRPTAASVFGNPLREDLSRILHWSICSIYVQGEMANRERVRQGAKKVRSMR